MTSARTLLVFGAGGTNLAQADDVFGKLDTNGDGSVSLDEMSSALKGAGDQGHHHAHRAGGGKQSGEDSLLQALDGASSTSTTNSDGSTTTSARVPFELRGPFFGAAFTPAIDAALRPPGPAIPLLR